MQYPLSPVICNRSSETFNCGARSCNANNTALGASTRYNHPGIGFPAQSALSSNSCRNGACGSGSARMYRYPSLLNGCSSGYPCAGSLTTILESPPSRPFLPGGKSPPANFRFGCRPTLDRFWFTVQMKWEQTNFIATYFTFVYNNIQLTKRRTTLRFHSIQFKTLFLL